MARTGVRQEDRGLAKTVENLERRISALEKADSGINISSFSQKPGSSYDQGLMEDFIAKMNEIILKLR
jgi:hypothetical protein